MCRPRHLRAVPRYSMVWDEPKVCNKHCGFMVWDEPKVCNKHCGFIKDGRRIRCAAGGNKNTKGQGGTDKRLRYRIPPLLIEELLL